MTGINNAALAAAERGAALLDEKGPAGWREKIDPNQIDMGVGHKCILGQLYRANVHDTNGYLTATAVLFPRTGTYDMRATAVHHGFHYPGGSKPYTSRELREAWQHLLSRPEPQPEPESVDEFIKYWGTELEKMYTNRTAGDNSFTGFVVVLMLDLQKKGVRLG